MNHHDIHNRRGLPQQQVQGTTAPRPGTEYSINFSQPLDFESTLFSGQAFRWRRIGEWYQGVVFGNVVTIRRTPEGLKLTTYPDNETWIAPQLVDYLGLHTDLEQVYSAIATDSRLVSAISRYNGMRVLRQDPWECLISFICTSASNIPRITKNIESICEAFGRPLANNDVVRHTFPSPEALAEGTETQIRDLGLGYRAAYLVSTARLIAEGNLDLYALREASYEEALKVLVSMYGVGDKVANCVLLFSMDKPEAFPVDTHINQSIHEWYLNNTKLNRVKLRMWAQEYFGPCAGYANHYLFHDRRLQQQARAVHG